MRRSLIVAGLGLVATALLAVGAVCLGSGCSTLGYYGQAVQGHLDLMDRARPVADWLNERGIRVWRGVSHEGREEPRVLEGLDLLVALGGGGTVLRAAHSSQ